MDLKPLRKHCAAKPGSYEDFPFDDVTMVIKTGGKMFGLIALEKNPLEISLKCNPYLAESLQKQYPAIRSGYHLNKKHWITILLDGSLAESKIYELIDLSYQLVFDKLTEQKKAEIRKI